MNNFCCFVVYQKISGNVLVGITVYIQEQAWFDVLPFLVSPTHFFVVLIELETIPPKVKYWEDGGQKKTFMKLDLVPNS